MPLCSGVVLDNEEAKDSTPRHGRLAKKREPHLYVNNSAVRYHTDRAGFAADATPYKPKKNDNIGDIRAKLFVMSKDPRKFIEAHGLQ